MAKVKVLLGECWESVAHLKETCDIWLVLLRGRLRKWLYMLSLAPKTAASRRFHTMLCTSACIWTWPFKQNPCVPHASLCMKTLFWTVVSCRVRAGPTTSNKNDQTWFFPGVCLKGPALNVSEFKLPPWPTFTQPSARWGFRNWQDWCSDGRSWRIWGSGGDSDILCIINYKIVLPYLSIIYIYRYYRYWMTDINRFLYGIDKRGGFASSG